MHEHHEDDPEVLSEIEKLGYDPRDVPVEKTWQHAVGLFAGVGAAMLLAWLVMFLIDHSQVGSKAGAPAVDRAISPEDPYPLLQSNRAAHEDIAALRLQEQIKTSTAGWVDKGKGVARVPVDVAKELVILEGIRPTGTMATPALGVAPEGQETDGPGGTP